MGYLYRDTVGELCKIKNEYKEKFGDKIVSLFKGKIEENDEFREIFLGENNKEAEYYSWKKSIPQLIDILEKSNLYNLEIIFEYIMPGSRSRIDALIIGKSIDDKLNIVLMELKQWSDIDISYEDSKDTVRFIYKGDEYIRKHPIAQLELYKDYLVNHHDVLSCSEINNIKTNIICCSYLHNFNNKENLFLNQYNEYKKNYYDTTFDKDENEIINFFKSIYSNEKIDKKDVNKIVNGTYIIGDIGFRSISKYLNGEKTAIILDEQREKIDLIEHEIKNVLKSKNKKQKSCFIVSGDVGVGKSVVGLEIIRRYIEMTGNKTNKKVYFSVINKTIKNVINGYSKNSVINTYDIIKFSGYEDLDLLIIDEAHRLGDIDIRGKNINFNEVIEILIKKSKIIVFLQDDNQRISIKEKGTLENIKEAIKIQKQNYNNLQYSCFTLKNQKRVNARSNYITLMNRFLSNDALKNISEKYNSQYYDIKIYDKRPGLLKIDDDLKKLYSNYQCKWIANQCWKWKMNKNKKSPIDKEPISIELDIYEENDKRFKKARNPNEYQYEYFENKNKEYLEQVACVFTMQGLDVDYSGVIFWNDLYWYDNKWRSDLNKIRYKTFIDEIYDEFVASEDNRNYKKDIIYYNELKKKWMLVLKEDQIDVKSKLSRNKKFESIEVPTVATYEDKIRVRNQLNEKFEGGSQLRYNEIMLSKDKKLVVCRECNHKELIKYLEDKNLYNEQIVTSLLKNIYRVIISRASKGTHIYFEDKNTFKRFKDIFNL